MYQPISPLPSKESLPTMYDLPSELIGESGLPDKRQLADNASPPPSQYLRSPGIDPDHLLIN